MVALQLCCPGCRQRFVAGSEQSGQQVPCPGCGRNLRVPHLPPQPRWFCFRQGQRSGPFSWDQLKQQAAQGELLPGDQLWLQGTPAWQPASSVPDLFPQPASGLQDSALATEEASSILDHPATAEERPGPLSLRGLRPRPLRSITLGDFQILKKLGSGSMGAVYLAQQRSQKRLLAVKVLSRLLSTQSVYVQRFYREAELMATLAHPNLVRLDGVGHEHEFHYFAMEYVDGCHASTLRERLGERLSVGDVLYVVRCTAQALRYAQEKHRVVHRDVKPSNLLLNLLGQVKVSDLGLARPLQEDLSLTDSGVGIGTPEYAAPEQMRNAKYADHRSDIYSLGGVLYHLLTGTLPFSAGGFGDLLLAKEQGHFIPARRKNRNVTERLDLMIDRMLSRDIRYRYQSYAELLEHLDGLGLANPHLSFNLLHVLRDGPGDLVAPADRVEVLLIHDEAGDILIAQEALDESGIPSNLSIVPSNDEALAFLTQQGKYANVSRPDLILLAPKVAEGDGAGVDLVAAIKKVERLRTIPILVLTHSPRAIEALQTIGEAVQLQPARVDQGHIQALFQRPEGGSTVVVVKRP